MAKFYGKVGFLRIEETAPDVHGEILTERLYKGDVIRNQKRYQSSEGLNDDVVLSSNISIVADSYANENVFAIKYVMYKGVPWKVTNVEIQRPRIILTLGGKYNVQEN